jgi:hypothetical protein
MTTVRAALGALRGLLPSRLVVLVWALVTLATCLPYVVAQLYPPRGFAFVGFLFFVDDMYHYLSYVQQAADGAFLFKNRLLPIAHSGQLINLEWWLVGQLSTLLGQRPALAYRLFGAVLGLPFLASIEWWLRRCAVPQTHRLAALLLTVAGAGLGGVQLLVARSGAPRFFFDLGTGLYPFFELLLNPHFVTGTALLLWSLAAYSVARTPRGYLLAALAGTTLGLVRPYDLVLLVAIRGLGVILSQPPRAALRALAPLMGLIPVVLYNYWVFYRSPVFAIFSGTQLAAAPLGALPWALAPALVLLIWNGRALVALCRRGDALPLALWVVLVLLILFLRPVTFALQFAVGLGAPLLILVAAGLARRRPLLTALAALALSTTALISVRLFLAPSMRWFAPQSHLAAVESLREACRPDDRLLAPERIGLFALGLTRCAPFLSHPYQSDYDARVARVAWFYAQATPLEREEFLAREGISYVLLPGDPGPRPASWLGEQTAFRRRAALGQGPLATSVYARPPAPERAP